MEDSRYGPGKDPFRRLPGKPERSGTGLAGGGAALLCCAAALCVTVLCLMALSRAQGARSLADRSMAEAAGYYSAGLAANADIASARASGEECAIDRIYGISDTQALRARAVVHPDGSFEILEWRAEPVSGWSADGRLHVAGWDE